MRSQQSSRSGAIVTCVIMAVLIVLLNVATFAIPFNKIDQGVLLTAYFMSEFVIAAEGTLVIGLLFGESDPNQKILGLPMVYSGFLALIVQTIATTVFYLCNAFVKLPIWVVAVVECVLIGYFIVQLALGFFFKNHIEEYHDNAGNTDFMDGFRAKANVIMDKNHNESLAKGLEDFYDLARGSDPVSNEKTANAEATLSKEIEELDEAVQKGDTTKASTVLSSLKDHLSERNTLCKARK